MDIRTHIKNANLKWDTLPTHYFEGPYVGNGRVGTIFWKDDDGKLLFEMGRSDFYDHRNGSYEVLYRDNRLKTGKLTLSIDSFPLDGNMVMDLYDAQVFGTLKTNKSEMKIRVFNCDDRDVIIIELEKVSGECDFSLDYIPYVCESPRIDWKPLEGYKPYPPAEERVDDGVKLWVQSLPEDEIYNNVGKGDAEFALAMLKQKDGNITRFYISMKYSYPGTTAHLQAKEEVIGAKNAGVDRLFEAHLDFWHGFWGDTLDISVPDKRMQNLYFLQTYRFASATRKTGPVIDLLGPWYCPTTWPAIWWNMNEQITYSHISFANHPEYVNPVIDLLYDGRKTMAENSETGLSDAYCLDRATAPTLKEKTSAQNEAANLAYMLYYLYESNRTVMDDKALEEKLLPLMKGAFRFLMTKTFLGDDGRTHFVSSASPEFTSGVEDASYTISAAKWLARTIIKVCKRLSLDDSYCNECQHFLDNVIDYLVDDNDGFMVGKDMPLNCFHTHWSHFFMVYPYGEYDFETDQYKDVINLTFEKWIKRQEEKFFAGFCTAGAMSLYALKGEGDNVLKRFDHYCNSKDFFYNGMFTDTIFKGRNSPVFETPIGVVRGILEMLLMYKREALHIFPALPSGWKEAEFKNMRTVSAFLVSAKYKNSKVTRVEIQSLAGEECIVKYDNLSHLKCNVEIQVLDGGYAKICVEKGKTAVFETV